MRFDSEKMIGFQGVARRLVLAAALAAIWAPFTFAAQVACVTPATTSNSHSDTTAGVPIAGAPGTGDPDDFASFATTTPTGCAATDINFQNFTQTGGSGNNGVYASLLSNSNFSTAPVEIVFSTIRGADSSGNGDGTTNDDSQNWIADRNTSETYTVNYTAVATGGTDFRYFTVNLNGVNLGGGSTAGTLSATIDLCLGGTWSGSTCSSGTTDSVPYVAGTYTYNLTLPGAYTTIGIDDSFTLNGGSSYSSGTTWLTSFDEDFSESPEPASFTLLGLGLAAIAGVRLRKRRA